MADPIIDLPSFETLATDYREVTVRLSADSLTLLLLTEPFTAPFYRWRGADGPTTPTEQDEIDNIVGTCYAELMTEVTVTANPLGTIFPLALAAVPTGALECDGSTYLRVDYPDLYAALDSAFITDADHFVVPDLRGRTILGVGTGSGLSTYAMNASGGAESHVLSTAELASHSHGVTDPGHNHTITDPGHAHGYTKPAADTYSNAGSAGFPKATAAQPTTNAVTNLSLASATTGVTTQNNGSGTAHENRQPYTALRYAIWAT